MIEQHLDRLTTEPTPGTDQSLPPWWLKPELRHWAAVFVFYFQSSTVPLSLFYTFESVVSNEPFSILLCAVVVSALVVGQAAGPAQRFLPVRLQEQESANQKAPASGTNLPSESEALAEEAGVKLRVWIKACFRFHPSCRLVSFQPQQVCGSLCCLRRL